MARYDHRASFLDRTELLHVRGPGLDPYKGAAPVELAREAIGLAMVLERHAAGLFGRGARPAGVLKMAGRLGRDQYQALRASWEQIHQGAHGSGSVFTRPVNDAPVSEPTTTSPEAAPNV